MKTTKKNVLKREDSSAVRLAAKVLRRLNRRAKSWSDRIDGMAAEKADARWRAEVDKFHKWAAAVEKETGTTLAACRFEMGV